MESMNRKPLLILDLDETLILGPKERFNATQIFMLVRSICTNDHTLMNS